MSRFNDDVKPIIAKPFDTKRLERVCAAFAVTYPERLYELAEIPALVFTDPNLRKVVESCRALVNQHGAAVDVNILIQHLTLVGIKEDDAVALLTELNDFVPPTPEAIRPVVVQLLGENLRRGVKAAGLEISTMADDRSVDAETLLQNVGRAHAALIREGPRVEIHTLCDALQEEARRMALGEGAVDMGLKTGLPELDEMIAGLRNGTFTVIGARPSMGKSSIAGLFAQSMAREVPGAMFSLEMRRSEWAMRMACAQGDIDLHRALKRVLTDDERARYIGACKELEPLPIFIYDSGGITLARMEATIRRLRFEQGLGWVVIDYFQLMEHVRSSRESTNDAMSRTSSALKSLAQSLEIPVIALSQLSRKCEERTNKRPILSDLRDTGALEQDADVVMFLYRGYPYMTQDERNGVTEPTDDVELIIAKQRNGPVGTVTAKFMRKCARMMPTDAVSTHVDIQTVFPQMADGPAKTPWG